MAFAVTVFMISSLLVTTTPLQPPDAASNGLGFIANAGQWPDDVAFGLKSASGPVFIMPDAFLVGVPTKALQRSAHEWIAFQFVGANPNPTVEPELRRDARVNIFRGRDPTHWHSDIATFERLRIRELYAGIDLVLHRSPRGLEYDVIVRAGADLSQLVIAVNGAQSIEQDGDRLRVRSRHGEIVQHAPVAWLETDDGRRADVTVRIQRRSESTFGFVAPSVVSGQLVIDPVLEIAEWYFSYLGGTGVDQAFDIAVKGGYAFLTGCTGSLDFPVHGPLSPGQPGQPGTPTQPFQSALSVRVAGTLTDADFDAFVCAVDPTGYQTVWCTYLGGSESTHNQGFPVDPYENVNIGRGIAIDGSGNVYVTGFTNAIGPNFPFPTTAGSFQPSPVTVNGAPDVFVTKLAPGGASLVYSTFLSGYDPDFGEDITVDSEGNAYVTGSTFSVTHQAGFSNTALDFPTSASGVVAPQASGVNERGFVTKSNPIGSSLVYSTFIDADFPTTAPGFLIRPFAIEIHETPEVPHRTYAYIAGELNLKLPNAPSAWPAGGAPSVTDYDGFVAVLDETASSYKHVLYFGDNQGNDRLVGIAVDATGEYTAVGDIYEVTSPTTPSNIPLLNAFQASHGGGTVDAFVLRADPFNTASPLVYGSYYGNFKEERATNVVVDSAGAAYVCGNGWIPRTQIELTNLLLLPTFNSTTDTGSFLIKIRGGGTGTQLKTQSYFGSFDSFRYIETWGIAIDSSAIYLSGRCTEFQNFPMPPIEPPSPMYLAMQEMYRTYVGSPTAVLPTFEDFHNDRADVAQNTPIPPIPQVTNGNHVPSVPYKIWTTWSSTDGFVMKVTRP